LEPEHAASSEASSPEARPSPALDVCEIELRDGAKIVVVDGQPYGEPDVRAARRKGGLRLWGRELAGCGLSAIWIFILLPLLGGLLLFLGLALTSCGSQLFGG
jgi:hypothetical protein